MQEVISRAEAKSRGLRHYFTGKPCKLENVSLRLTSTGACLCDGHKKVIENGKREWLIANKEYSAQYQRNYSAKHKEKKQTYLRNWRIENKDSIAEYQSNYRTENIEILRPIKSKYCLKRLASKLNATPSWHGELDKLVESEAHDLAALRHRSTGIAWHVDHMIPMQGKLACGLHCATNLQVIPAVMNIRKSNKMILTEPGEWILALL